MEINKISSTGASRERDAVRKETSSNGERPFLLSYALLNNVGFYLLATGYPTEFPKAR